MKAALGTAIFLIACLGESSAAQIYRHVDEQGVVHFSDAPMGQDDQVIDQIDLEALMTIVPGTVLPDAARQAEAQEAQAQARASRSTALRRAQQARAADAARCGRYRSRLDGIQSRLRGGYRINEGNRLRTQRRDLQALIARECRGRP